MNEKFELFLDAVSDCPGFDRSAMVQAQDSVLPVSVRLNPSRNTQASTVFGSLLSNQVPWSTNGWYLKERPLFTLDPHLHAGTYYVQEASSMFIEQAVGQVLNEARNLNALDLCAAPGGKSTLLASMPQFKLVVANELISSRVSVLQENIVKWGSTHVFVTNNDVADFARLGTFFDVVLVDAPCSGSGLFRKDPDAMNEWSQDAVVFCAQRQRRILKDAAELLDDGGILIYSTCSFSREENEDNADFLVSLGFESVQLHVDPSWGVIESVSDRHYAFGYRFYPDKLLGEGFFCTVMRKVSNAALTPIDYSTKIPKPVVFPEKHVWLSKAGEYYFTERETDILAIPAGIVQELFQLKTSMRMKKSGTRLGRLIRGELIPDHELALSEMVAPDLPGIELTRDDAIRYLRRDSLKSDLSGSGWYLIKFEQVCLGWIKISQGKIKNNYPMSWRVLMQP